MFYLLSTKSIVTFAYGMIRVVLKLCHDQETVQRS